VSPRRSFTVQIRKFYSACFLWFFLQASWILDGRLGCLILSKTVVKAVRTALETTRKPPLNPYRWLLPRAAVGWGRAAPQGADASFPNPNCYRLLPIPNARVRKKSPPPRAEAPESDAAWRSRAFSPHHQTFSFLLHHLRGSGKVLLWAMDGNWRGPGLGGGRGGGKARLLAMDPNPEVA
jgi:hypothetical protein